MDTDPGGSFSKSESICVHLWLRGLVLGQTCSSRDAQDIHAARRRPGSDWVSVTSVAKSVFRSNGRKSQAWVSCPAFRRKDWNSIVDRSGFDVRRGFRSSHREQSIQQKVTKETKDCGITRRCRSVFVKSDLEELLQFTQRPSFPSLPSVQ